MGDPHGIGIIGIGNISTAYLTTLLGVEVPTLDLRPLEATSPMKLLHALSLLGGAP